MKFIKNEDSDKFVAEFLTVAFPDWLRTNTETHNFRGFVLDKHTVLEHLIDLLLVAHYFGDINSAKGNSFKTSILNTLDFAKKVKAVELLGLIDKDLRSKIFQVNDFRLAQAHIKKDDPLRQPTPENWKLFQEISTQAHSAIASRIMVADATLRNKVMKMISD